MANWLTRLFRPAEVRAAEGTVRPSPYALADGWLAPGPGRFWNWWQMGYSLTPSSDGSGAMVEACISAYAQTVAMCPGDHWRRKEDGGRERVKNSSLSRVIKKPNDYQSSSDFMLNLVRRLYQQGEAFGVAIRNDRYEISELHLMRDGSVALGEDGSIFYKLSGNEIAERRFDFSLPIPARDVLHVRLHTPRHPLKGESPIVATALERSVSGAALNQQVAFYLNQARPSFMLQTDEKLTPDQTKELRALWNEQTRGDNAGGTPILTWGLKANKVDTTPQDAQLAELLKMGQESIALAFRLPLQVLGIGGTPFASTEALMSAWKATGLGFALNHIEEAFGLLFGLKGMPDEYLEFDADALLRSSFKERIEALSNGTRRVYTINEARALEGLPRVEGGDEVRVQQQDVPLSYGANMQPPNPAPPTSPKQDEDDDGGRGFADFARQIDDATARHTQSLH